jgi:signal transduction histidine kinase
MEEGVPARGAEIVLQKGLDCVSVSVGDNGPGIDRAIVRRIFDPFFTTKTSGTGLGLPMVKRTVNAHGGIVTVRSTKGKGAVVEILLPLRPGAPAGYPGGAGRVHSGGER